MAVKIVDKIVQMNGQNYPLMDASAVEYKDTSGNTTNVKDYLDGMPSVSTYTKSEIDNKLKDKADTSVIGDINNLIVVGVTDLVSAINKSVVSMGYAGTGLKQLLLDFTGLNLIAKTSKTGFLGLKLSLDGVTTSALSATTAILSLHVCSI